LYPARHVGVGFGGVVVGFGGVVVGFGGFVVVVCGGGLVVVVGQGTKGTTGVDVVGGGAGMPFLS
jgi:hypothetical protein